MIRIALLAAAVALAACGSQNKPLPMVKDNAPVTHLNPDQWPETVNDLIHPPTDGTPVKADRL